MTKRIAFVTNRSTHYTVPIFELLAQSYDIEFYFTAIKPGRWWTLDHDEASGNLKAHANIRAIDMYREIRDQQFSCVVIGLSGRSHLAAAALAVARSAVPRVVWVDMWKYPHSIIHAMGRPVVRHILVNADATVSCGSHITKWIASEIGRSENVYEMRYAVDNAKFSDVCKENSTSMRASFGVSASKIGCYVGRLEPEKGLLVLLDAIARTKESVGLVIVGSGSMQRKIDERIGELGLSDRVCRIGWVKQIDIPTVYAACDFLVLPSISTALVTETWGLEVNEAIASGIGVIVSDAVGAAAGGLVTDNETGLVVPEGNRDALARAMDRFAIDADLRKTLIENALGRIEQFSFESCRDTFSAAIESAIEARTRCAGMGRVDERSAK